MTPTPAYTNPTEALMRDIAELDLWQPAAELALAGYTVVPDVLSRSETWSLRSRVTDHLASATVADGEPTSHQVGNLFHLGGDFLRCLGDERVSTLLAAVLGDGAILSSISVHAIPPGAMADPRPDDPLAVRSTGVQALHATAVCCLNDLVEGRGTLDVVAGSHLAIPHVHPGPAVATSVDCPVGSVVVVNGNLWHRFGPYDRPGTLPSINIVTVHCRNFIIPRESYPTPRPV